MIPYDQVLKELVLALGAALFLANAYALLRRGADAEAAATPAPGTKKTEQKHDLPQAPVGRTVLYMLVGLVVAIWAFASIVN